MRCIIIAVCMTMITDACRNSRVLLTRRVPSEELFSYLSKRIFKSFSELSIKTCAQKCFVDLRCTDAVICSQMCYMAGVMVQSLPFNFPDTSNCSILQMNRCLRRAKVSDGGNCKCPDGFGGRYCLRRLNANCVNHWQRLPSINDSSMLRSEVKPDQHGPCESRIKIMVDNNLLNIHEFGQDTHLWAESGPTFLKNSWNKFSDVMTRRFMTILDNGHLGIMDHNINGSMTKRSTMNTSVIWFVEKNLEEAVNDTDSGGVENGSMKGVLERLETGDSFYRDVFFKSNLSVVTSLPLYLPRTSNNTFQSYDLLRFGWVDTSGQSMFALLKIGTSNISSTSLLDTNSRGWCLDSCWIEAMTAGPAGRVRGSLTYLILAVRHGFPIRVRFDDVSVPAKSVYVNGYRVSVLAHIISPIEVKEGPMSPIQMRITIISTDGSIQTRTKLVDTDTILDNRNSESEIRWFVDLHRWNMVHSVNGNGTKVKGSLVRLYAFVQNGFSVRIGMEYTDGVYHAVEADNLSLAPNGHVAADVVYHTTVKYTDGSTVEFMPSSFHHNWVSIITTEGTFEKRYYTLGRTDIHTEYVYNVLRFDWFVQK